MTSPSRWSPPVECDYNTNPDPLGAPTPCRRHARFVFEKQVKVKGRSNLVRYPRCNRHASPSVQSTAAEQGYAIHEV